MYQDANGKVGDDPALLTPPLVSVKSVALDGGSWTGEMDLRQASRIFARNEFRTGYTGSFCVKLVFTVSPPAYLESVLYENGTACVVKIEGGNPTKSSPEIRIAESGLFVLRDTLEEKVSLITLTIPRWNSDMDSKRTHVRFIFGQPAPVIASVGLALRAHEASMDCKLLTDDGEEVGFHRAVLAARSAYFDKLFFGEFKESKTDVVKVEGGTTTWQCINAMLYTQTLPKSDRITLIRTLEIVYHYDLEAFAASVWHALVRKLDGVVAVRALRVAGLHQNKEISAEAMEFIKEHILTLMLDREWVRRYADVLEEITDPGRPSLGT